MDSCSPRHVPSPAGSIGSIGSGAYLPLGGHIPHTHSKTPLQTRVQSSSSSSCSCHLDYDADGHESKGSGSPPGTNRISNGMTRPTKVCLITWMVRNLMVMPSSEMKVASKTMPKRLMSPVVMRLAVKLRAVRCLLARWPRVESLRWILRTVKIHFRLQGDHALSSHTQEGVKGGQTQHSTLVLTAIPGPETARGAA